MENSGEMAMVFVWTVAADVDVVDEKSTLLIFDNSEEDLGEC